MRTTTLGRSGIRISRLCFGTMSFGGEADEAESARLYAACRDAGVTVFDCAESYADGRAEAILGRLAAHERDAVVLTTKIGYGRPGSAQGEASRRSLLRAIEGSLRRLGTDRVDVLFLHRFDPATGLETTLRALEDILRDGKATALGVSNFAAWQIATALGIQVLRGWERLACVQPMYNLVKRQAEVEILPLAAAEGLGVLSYSPLGGGLLTGKYAAGKAGRLAENPRYAARYRPDWMHRAAEGLLRLAADRDVHPASLAVAWAGAHPAVTAPIIGARTVAQLRPSLAAAAIEITPELRAAIAALGREPPPATDRLEERTR